MIIHTAYPGQGWAVWAWPSALQDPKYGHSHRISRPVMGSLGLAQCSAGPLTWLESPDIFLKYTSSDLVTMFVFLRGKHSNGPLHPI